MPILLSLIILLAVWNSFWFGTWYAKTVRIIPDSLSYFFAVGHFLSFPPYYHLHRSEVKDRTTISIWPLFWFGSITSLFLLLAAGFHASNTMLYESADYMAIGMLCFFMSMTERETLRISLSSGNLLISAVCRNLPFIHKGFLRCTNTIRSRHHISSHGRRRKRAPWQESTVAILMDTNIIFGISCYTRIIPRKK